LICPLGNSVPAALARAKAGESGIRAFESPWIGGEHPELRWRVGGTVEGFVADDVLEPRFAARQEPGVLYAMAAAAEAIAQAGLDGVDRGRIGTAIGGGLPGAELWHRALRSAYGDGRPEDIARCTAMAIAAMADGVVLPTTNLDDPDPECDLDYVPHEARRHPIDVLVKNSFGAGGAATSLVLWRAPSPP